MHTSMFDNVHIMHLNKYDIRILKAVIHSEKATRKMILFFSFG